MTQPYDVKHASKQYQDWLTTLVEEASLATHNQAQAMMRAVMHELRRSVPPDAVLAIANALPALPRGIFIEGWSLDEPSAPPASADAFAENVRRRIEEHHAPPASITANVFAVWARFLAPAHSQAIAERLPDALKPLWPASA